LLPQLFDPDLINLPLPENIPPWYHARDAESAGEDTDYETEETEPAAAIKANETGGSGEGDQSEVPADIVGGRDPGKGERGVG
jgi:hypothetical protein